ncbi:MAG: bifunctional DNA-formamidopyrimidine glycosylase/DNA-(apurinic or apyrimidinic site) lyase [Candidatus Taylorbacteria bacterium]|nr:bifunctional DNA-formamidopyrimidine glycosylase/DNA-(apurinic or apyrimidinic site) lyase [Candidatus Taylorbacteria bacterium]
MPELPEVQTTVDGINALAKGASIKDVWTDYGSAFHAGKDDIKDPDFFARFKKLVRGARIEGAARRAKNVLIALSNGRTVIVHMKMTGHFLYGRYEKRKSGKDGKEEWLASGPGPLRDDPFNRHIRLVFILDNGRHLALSDLRRFAKVTIAESDRLHESKHLSESGPEPLDPSFDLQALEARLARRPQAPIKLALMDHTLVAGIGNIYSDEILWRAGVHPLEKAKDVPKGKVALIFAAMKETLRRGIALGGDSMSDYRNVLGLEGKFQERHRAYRRTGERCSKAGCKGVIRRIKIGGRSGHYCDLHQKKRAPKP